MDIEKPALETLIAVCEDFDVSGYVATNTSSVRKGLNTPGPVLESIGNGGLSGRAIRERSTQVVRWIREIAGKGKPIIGVGGIDSVEAAIEKLDAGADLLQIYTGLVYKGPGLVPSVKKGLTESNLSH